MANFLGYFFSKEFWIIDGWDLVQVLLSIIGFYIAYRQLRKTRDSIEVAKDATNKTRNAIQERFSIIDSTEIANGLKLLKENINSKNIDKALWRLDDILIRIIQLSKRPEYVDTEEKKTRVTNMIEYFRNLGSLLRENNNTPENLNTNVIIGKLTGIMIEIYGWTESSKFHEE